MPSPPVPDRTETLAPRPKRPSLAGDLASDPTEAAPVRLSESAPPSSLSDDPDRYEQVGEHARGGLGRVVRAVDKRLGRTVAVKELLRHDASNEARFLREAMITARLEHPGIVPVHEAGRWPNGDPYYVMKLVEGRTLKELIDERKTLRERLELLPNVIAIADAVGYAHSEGVIHRDLKPSNVIVGEFGETIVVDWGLARDRKRTLEIGFCFCHIWLRRQKCDFSGNAIDLGLAPFLLGSFHRGHRFADAAPGIIRLTDLRVGSREIGQPERHPHGCSR